MLVYLLYLSDYLSMNLSVTACRLSICPPAWAVRWKKKTWPLWRTRPRQFAFHRPKNIETHIETPGLLASKMMIFLYWWILMFWIGPWFESSNPQKEVLGESFSASPWRILPALPSLRTSANFGARGHSTTFHNYVYAGGLGLFCLPMAPPSSPRSRGPSV